MSVDSKGQLVLVSQADSELIFVNAQAPAAGGVQDGGGDAAGGHGLADWPGRLLVVDGGSGMTYWVTAAFAKGDIYTQSPNDSGIDNFVAVIAPATGFETPIAIGFQKATGMVFVPNSLPANAVWAALIDVAPPTGAARGGWPPRWRHRSR